MAPCNDVLRFSNTLIRGSIGKKSGVHFTTRQSKSQLTQAVNYSGLNDAYFQFDRALLSAGQISEPVVPVIQPVAGTAGYLKDFQAPVYLKRVFPDLCHIKIR